MRTNQLDGMAQNKRDLTDFSGLTYTFISVIQNNAERKQNPLQMVNDATKNDKDKEINEILYKIP